MNLKCQREKAGKNVNNYVFKGSSGGKELFSALFPEILTKDDDSVAAAVFVAAAAAEVIII